MVVSLRSMPLGYGGTFASCPNRCWYRPVINPARDGLHTDADVCPSVNRTLSAASLSRCGDGMSLEP